MAQQAYPASDGVAPSWANQSVVINTLQGAKTVEMGDLLEISGGTTVEVGEQYGEGGDVVKRTSGLRKRDAKMVLYKSGQRVLFAALAEEAPLVRGVKQLSGVVFDIVQNWDVGEPEIHTRVFEGCRLIGDTESNSRSVDPDKAEHPISVTRIYRVINGEKVEV